MTGMGWASRGWVLGLGAAICAGALLLVVSSAGGDPDPDGTGQTDPGDRPSARSTTGAASASQPATASSAPAPGETPAVAGPARSALCQVRPVEVTKLVTTTASQNVDPEQLRDAIPILHDRIEGVASFVVPSPAVDRLLTHLQSVEADWRDAVAAQDYDRQAVSQAAIASAAETIALLDADVRALQANEACVP